MTNHKDKLPRIMTVDDEVEVATVICDYFREEGYEITGYTDAQAALIALGDSTVLPDVILVDIMMPSVDGYEFSRRLQNEPRLSNIPVIFLTGKDRGDDALTFLKSGGQLYVKKPFHLSDLKNLILLSAQVGFQT
ncbi:MAG: response regulator [candidate division Zixibacteria bacterium]|nr:response regulator [candidate division Zixibacteria bacterium]